MTRKKLIIIVGVVLVVLGGAYKFVLNPAKPVKDKVAGELYVLPKEFTINLADGHYTTVTVALLLAPGQSDGSTGGEGASTEPAGFGTLPEEPLIRDLITGVITNQTSDTMISPQGRSHIKAVILKAIRQKTDVKVDAVLFTDVAVQ